ncbi:DgyrCDS597 [Dimorphilus gyrociliatus]|uniref:Dihydrolipoyllysine-residue succinyltransferase component of 2-oxoglutarate dehydrogenase complex, mitochondrial n=1 Tax=Dimorphilus gyrociliatus TaxID=2664684 RepID=A0A7I8V4Y0_9ANNE|nr:DgyrCDS597 [Dimorphilus gyrociliatus]
MTSLKREKPNFSLSAQKLSSHVSKRFLRTTIKLDDRKTIVCPPLAESISEGDIVWLKDEGDFVGVDETIAELENDKANIPIKSPYNGLLQKLIVESGDTVSPGGDLCIIEEGAAGAPPPAAAAPPPPPSPSSPKATEEPPKTSSIPDSTPIPTTPPPVPQVPSQPISSKPAESVKAQEAQFNAFSLSNEKRSEKKVKMNRMRLKIAQRLKEAQNTCAMLTTFNEIDMSNIISLRKQYQEAFQKKHGFKLGFMSAFLKASAYALTDQPVVNAVIDDNHILYRDYVDISVAVATPKGLVVPVVRNVESMSFADIEKSLVDLGEKAKTGALAIEDMEGGTFTVSNGGVFGSMFGTPIINPPQSAILGMHGVFQRPVAVDGKVEIRPMMYIALTYDHRLIDGREGVTFLKKIKSAVEDPRMMFLDL